MLAYLVRHGQSFNTHPSPGQTDPVNPPLTPVGLAQAERVALRLRPLGIDCVVSSPMIRAVETARAIGAVVRRQVEIWPRCHEHRETPGYPCWGARELRLHYPDLVLPPDFAEDDWEYGNEPLEHVVQRADEFLEWLASLAGQRAGLRMVVVSHGAFTRIVFGRAISAEPAAMERVVVDNTAVSTLEVAPGSLTVLGFNDTSHLAGIEGLDPVAGVTR